MSSPPPAADLLVVGDVITMDPQRRVLLGAAVAVAEGSIIEVGAERALRAAHPGATVVGRPGDLVTPGFVNAHQHLTADRLIRSFIPDDLAPGASIFSWVVPVHAVVSGDDDELSATLSLVEAVSNGITTTVEAGTVAHPDRVAAAMRAVGVRGTLGVWGTDTAGLPGSGPADEVLDVQRGLLDRFPAGTGDLVTGWVTLVGHDLMTDELAAGASALAAERGVGLTFHLSPTTSDPISYLARTGRRPAVHLDDLGVLGPHVLLAHAVHIDEDELKVLLRTGTAVVSCPWAYLRLGQGYTRASRHLDLWRQGGRLALGCDAENAADAVDGLRVAALFAGLAKDMPMDPTGFGAHDALELLTVRGAESIGMAEVIGSIEPGKQADLVVHRTDGPAWTTRSPDPVLQLVWASDGRSVRDVVVAGRVVVRDGRCTTVDVPALAAAAEDRGRALLAEAGVRPVHRWPVLPAG
jgi:5-methylthioadenosine/S-adenosylhomocysteine deaminase